MTDASRCSPTAGLPRSRRGAKETFLEGDDGKHITMAMLLLAREWVFETAIFTQGSYIDQWLKLVALLGLKNSQLLAKYAVSSWKRPTTMALTHDAAKHNSILLASFTLYEDSKEEIMMIKMQYLHELLYFLEKEGACSFGKKTAKALRDCGYFHYQSFAPQFNTGESSA